MAHLRIQPRISAKNMLWALALIFCPLAHANIEVVVATAGERADVGISNDTVGFMYHFSVSPNGQWWAGRFELENSLDDVHLRGQSLDAVDVIWSEGQAAPGSLAGTLRSVSEERQTSINNSGEVAGLARIWASGVNLGQLVYRYAGSTLKVLAETNQPIGALPAAFYGFDFQSPNINDAGFVSFYADNITGPTITSADDAITLSTNGNEFGGTRKGLSSYAGNPLTRIDPDQFVVSDAGDRFVFAGDTTAGTATDDLIVVGAIGTQGDVIMQEGVSAVTTASGAELFDVASRVVWGGDDWFASGDTVGGTGVVLRNGLVIASEGDTAPDGFAYVGDPLALAADINGNVAWAWRTNNPDLDRDMLLVYNGNTILVTDNDTFSYDADSDGVAEEIRIDRLFEDFFDLALAGEHAYLMTELDTPESTVFVGYGFLRIRVSSDSDGDGIADGSDNCIEVANNDQRDTNGDGFGNICDADLNNDGTINFTDLGLLRTVFFGADTDADFNGDGVVNFLDLGILRSTFFGAPGPSGLQSGF